jgi:flagellar biosynthetic protein FliQ
VRSVLELMMMTAVVRPTAMGTAVGIGRGAVGLMLVVAALMLIAGLLTGLATSVLQAVSQINRITIPKIVATALALVLLAPWMIIKLVTFTTAVFERLPSYTH